MDDHYGTPSPCHGVGANSQRCDSRLDPSHHLCCSPSNAPGKTSAPCSPSSSAGFHIIELKYLPSTASHTWIPFADSEWREHRTVTLPDAEQEDVIWVCGRRIPGLEHVWPPHFRMGFAARAKRQERLIREAREADALRRRWASEAVQARLREEQGANHARLQRLWRLLVLPIKEGRVIDDLRRRQRVGLMKAHFAAVRASSRLRRDPEGFTSLAASLQYQTGKALRSWRRTWEGGAMKQIRVHFRVGVRYGIAAEAFAWLWYEEVELVSMCEPREMRGRMVAAAKRAYGAWVLTRPAEERAELRGQGFGRRVNPRLEASAYVTGSGRWRKVEPELELEEAVGEFFAAVDAGSLAGTLCCFVTVPAMVNVVEAAEITMLGG